MQMKPKGRRLVLVATVLMGTAALPTQAIGVPVSIRGVNVWLHGGNLSEWQATNTIDYCTASGALGFSDAVLETPTGDRMNDAFDGAMAYEVGLGDSEYEDDDGVVNKTGESIKGDSRTLAGLRVSVTHSALPQKAVMRSLLKLVNGGSRAKTRPVLYVNNSGGDGNEDIRITDDGDDDLEAGDSWAVTSDHPSSPVDPVKTWGLYGPGNVRERVVEVHQEPDLSDCLTVEFSVRVPARSTRYLLMFTRLTATNRAGHAAASDFDQEKAYLFKGLEPGVRDRVLNWDVS